MKVHLAQVVKDDYFDERVNGNVTAFGIALHPIIKVNEENGTVDVSHEGIRPTIVFNSQVVDHTDIVRALRDMADMIEKQLDGKTTEEFLGE
jgi:hypothetical protein